MNDMKIQSLGICFNIKCVQQQKHGVSKGAEQKRRTAHVCPIVGSSKNTVSQEARFSLFPIFFYLQPQNFPYKWHKTRDFIVCVACNQWLGAARHNLLQFNRHYFSHSFCLQFIEEMATTSFYTLFESSSGFALFNVLESEEIASMVADVQNGTTDFSRFQRVVRLLAFQPFVSAEDALESISAITEHEVTEGLRVSSSLLSS